MKLPLAIAALIATLPPVLAQTWSRTVARPGDDSLWAAREAPGGGVVALGLGQLDTSTLTRLDASGALVWSRELDGVYLSDLAFASDGGILVCGEWVLDEGWVGKLDASGNLLWQWRAELYTDFGENDSFRAIRELANGEILVVGNHESLNEADYDSLLYRLDASGNVLWCRTINNFESQVTTFVELNDGTFLLAGSRSGDLMVLRVSADGSQLLVKSVFQDEDNGRAVADRTSDGNVVIATGFERADADSWFDPDVWYSFAGTGFRVLEVDPSGVPIWFREYAGGGDDAATAVRATPDGGSVVVGHSTSFGADGRDVRVLKLDADGGVEWQRMYGGDDDDEPLGVDVTADGGYLVAGRTRSTSGAWDGFLLRLDSQGRVAGCETPPTWSAPADVTRVTFEPFAFPLDPGASTNGTALTTLDSMLSSSPACLGTAIGARYCDPAQGNSTGVSAELWVGGDDELNENDAVLVASALPVGQFGYFLTGMSSNTSMPPGTQGVLCLTGGPIFRYVDQVQSSGPAGAFGIAIDVQAIPGHGAIQPGETWNFQAWFRDKNPTQTSNFTDAVAVQFQ